MTSDPTEAKRNTLKICPLEQMSNWSLYSFASSVVISWDRKHCAEGKCGSIVWHVAVRGADPKCSLLPTLSRISVSAHAPLLHRP